MRRTLTPLLATFLVLSLLAPAWAQVKDSADFFTPNATERANQLISQLRQQTGHDVIIETLPSLPQDQQAQLQSMGKDRFFQQYTAQRARQAGISGIYVLITRDPSHLQVAVGDQTARSGLFTAADRNQLRDTLLTNFRAKNYDQGLLDGVAFAQRTMTANASAAGRTSNKGTIQSFPGAAATPSGRTAPTAAPPARSTGHSGFFWLVVVGGALLLLVFILRRVAARASTYSAGPGYTQASNVPPPLPGQQPPYGGYPGYGAGTGGGFGRGILGGLLGGAAGGWLYDRMSHRNDAGAAYPGQGMPSGGGNPDAYPPSAPDTDFSSSSGGDFGGSSDMGGGGDFGGGGDSGGGGGDSGGGGGDF